MRMNKRTRTTLICLCIILSHTACGYAISNYFRQSRKQKLSGAGKGEAFAPYYDTNTVITVTGKVTKAGIFEAEPLNVKAVRVFLETEDKTYAVHLGPVWYIRKQPLKLTPGDIITVTGSLINKAIMAQQLKKGNQIFLLRDKAGQPKWFKEGKPGVGNPGGLQNRGLQQGQ